MAPVLATDVHVEGEGGQFVVLKAGDSVPEKFASLVTNPKAFREDESESTPEEPTTPEEPGYSALDVDQLKALLKERELPVTGKQEELVARLLEADSENLGSGSGQE